MNEMLSFVLGSLLLLCFLRVNVLDLDFICVYLRFNRIEKL